MNQRCESYTFLKKIDSVTKGINPTLIKKTVEYYRQFDSQEDKSKSVKPVVSTATLLAPPNVNIKKANTAFGRLAMPKLRKLLLHYDRMVSRQAIVTLLDSVHDPEKAVEAVRLNVLARLVRLMVSYDQFTRQHVLSIIKVLATQPKGPEGIVRNVYILNNLKLALLDEDSKVRLQAAYACRELCRNWLSYKCLVDNGFVERLIEAICNKQKKSALVVMLNALEYLFDRSDDARKRAIKKNICQLLLPSLVYKSTKVRAAAIEVLSQIFVTREGRHHGEKCPEDLVLLLTEALNETDENLLKAAAIALANLFITTPSKLRGVELRTIDKLLPLALCSKDTTMKINAMQALTNLAAAPAVKNELQENYLPHIALIDTQNCCELMIVKDRFIEVVTHQV